MKKVLVILALALAFGARAQETPAGFCGTPAYKSQWLENYQQNPPVTNRSMLDTLYVPVTIHIVGQSNGSGYIAISRLMGAFCHLNRAYEQAAIKFYIKGNIRYINNNNYYNHNYSGGAQMMRDNNVPNTMNCYIVNDPAGACGYYLPGGGGFGGDAVALSKGCLGPNDYTWPHEAGHYLSLPHTFYGWEETEYNYNSPTPNVVNWGGVSRQVEKVNGSNCNVAGDGFCDTPPDYLSGRWNCNGAGMSPQIQKDPNGVEFRSDGSLIMAYSNDECITGFSEGQIGAMRANLQQQRPGHLANQTPPTPVASTELTPIFPPEGQALPNNEAFELRWAPIAGAQIYFVDIAIIPTFGFTLASYTVATNSVAVAADELLPDKTYYWRIRPFNRYDGCTGYSDTHTFELSDVVSATAAPEAAQGLRLYPNPARENQEVILEFTTEKATEATVSLLSLTGQALHSRRMDAAPGANRMNISTAGLAKGLYVLRIEANGGASYQKLMVQ